MPDEDDEYVQSEDEDGDANNFSGGRRGQIGKSGNAARGAGGFEVTRTWEQITESNDGTIGGSIEELLEAKKRRR